MKTVTHVNKRVYYILDINIQALSTLHNT